MASNISLTGLARDLEERGKSGKPIRIGLIGSGEMGTDIVTRVAHMSGIEIGAISELNLPAASKAVDIAFQETGHAREVSNASAMTAAMEAGKIAVTSDSSLVIGNDLIDVVIDATGVPAVGAEIGLRAMEHGKHLVMMNVEADVTIGAYLKAEADRLGVTYSLGAGDEPSSCMELIEFVSAMGHPIVAAGKGKNNPLNIDATPPDYEEEAKRRHMNVRMLVEFVDGSKTMVEVAAIANATGLVPDKPGMHGPAATLGELSKVLVPEKHGGVLSKVGVVDYSIGKGVAPGVFCIIETRHPRVLERMIDLKVGKGPYFTIFRPYHLTSLEVPLSAARAVVYKRADMEPLDHPVAEAVAVAKSNLGAGQSLGMIGENDYRGFAMTWEDARARGALPLGLAERAKVVKPVKAGDFLTYENCVPDDSMVITQIRRRLDQSDGRFVTNAA